MDSLNCPHIQREKLLTFSSLALAHMGDSVYEILVRAYLCAGNNLTNGALHKKTVELVCAKSQACAARMIHDTLDDEEKSVFSRARNARVNNIPKSALPADYALATALEAVFGYLYLSEKVSRINELFEKCKSTF